MDIFATPLGWVLSFLYNITDSYIISLVVLTVTVRAILLPSSIKQQKNAARQTRLNAKVNKIRTKYAGNQQKIQEETQALYQREGFGAANMGCTSLIIQMLVMFGLYSIIRTPITSVLSFTVEEAKAMADALGIVVSQKGGNASTYQLDILTALMNNQDKLADVIKPERVQDLINFREGFYLFGIDLAQTPTTKVFSKLWLIPILSCATSLASSLFMFVKQRKNNPEMAKNPTMGCMTFMSPVMSLWFTFQFPAGVGMYWILSNVISFIQQVALAKFYSPKKVIAQQMVDETVTRRSREDNIKRRVEIEKK